MTEFIFLSSTTTHKDMFMSPHQFTQLPPGLSAKIESPLEAAFARIDKALATLDGARGSCVLAADKFCGDEPNVGVKDNPLEEPYYAGIVGKLHDIAGAIERNAVSIRHHSDRLNAL